jgi:ribitol-5-phosphate 2-dehydrogenase
MDKINFHKLPMNKNKYTEVREEVANTSSKTFISRTYRLISPYQVEEVQVERVMNPGEVMVKPILCSICHADLRYYTGNRRPEILAKKLPMALIHEGIGEVVESASVHFKPGQRVVIVPNIPGYNSDNQQATRADRLSSEPTIEDNYSTNGHFLGSGYDGIAQSHLILPDLCLVLIPQDVPEEIAVLSELSSVSHQALRKVKDQLATAKIAIFGDGPVGFLTAALLHHYYNVGADRLTVFGVVPEKMAQFSFATCISVIDSNLDEMEKVDIAIECAGGRFSSAAINQAIVVLKPGGSLILMGVTEELVPINTRDILEKGITLFGSSRSSFHDYPPIVEAKKNQEYQQTLRKLLPEQFNIINSAEEFAAAMQHTSEHPHWKKTILEFRW